MSEWWENVGNLSDLFAWMSTPDLENCAETDGWTMSEVAEYLEKPWMWAPEWERFQAAQPGEVIRPPSMPDPGEVRVSTPLPGRMERITERPPGRGAP